MRITFGNTLLQFANSVDILEEENFKKIQEYIESYLKKVLHIRFVRLMLIRETVGGEVMLVKYSLNTGLEEILMLRDSEGNYNGQMPYAFAKNKRLWITPLNKEETLDTCSVYVDHWSGEKKFPDYRTINNSVETRTSIIIPIRRDNKMDNNNHILGVVNFESEDYLKPNKQAQDELKNISFTLGKLFQLYENRRFQRTNTSSVINELGKDLDYFKEEHRGYFFARRPKVFFAFSSKADRAVVGTVKELIGNSFKEELNLIHWDNDENLGSITPQLLENMSNSDYLVCYLSEKEEEELTYHDNPNVLIELGYFIGKHTYLSNLKNILIIREEKSEKSIPFDIKDIVTLSVARFDENNKVNKDILINDLRVKIDSFLTYIVHK
jgi:predicted nucleotide-binding protein